MGSIKSSGIILIIDDVPALLTPLGDYLEEHNFTVSFCDNGESALQHLHEFGADLVLLDIIMPGMNGIEVCEKIKSSENLKDIPVVFLTARTDEEFLVRGFCNGAADYITKPFRLNEVLARICFTLELDLNFYFKDLDISKFEHNPDQLISRTREYISHNYQKNITLNDISDYANLSTSRLASLFKIHTGDSCMQYLTKVRISEACKLLLQSSIQVSEIAYEVGFNDSNYFSVVFKRNIGVSPLSYRKGLSL